MKKLIALLMVLVLACSLTLVSFAVEGDFELTRALTQTFDEHDFHYGYDGLSSSGREKLYFTYTYDFGFSVEVTILIDENGSTVGLKMWDFLKFDPSNFADITALCNTLNKDTKFAKFYTDESDNTVNITLDVVVMNAPNSSEIICEAIDWILLAAKDVYPQFAPYAL